MNSCLVPIARCVTCAFAPRRLQTASGPVLHSLHLFRSTTERYRAAPLRRRPCCARLVSAAAAEPPAELPSSTPPKRLAVFVSGGGSNFRAIHAYIQREQLAAEVAAVVTNAPSCGGAEYARQHGIPVLIYPAPKKDPSAGLTPEELVAELQQVGVGCSRFTAGAALGCCCVAGPLATTSPACRCRGRGHYNCSVPSTLWCLRAT